MRKLSVDFKQETQSRDPARLRRMSLIIMSFAAVLLGLFILYVLMEKGYSALNESTPNLGKQELQLSCQEAMTSNNIVDSGGCQCITQAALSEGSLTPKQQSELKRYFTRLKFSSTLLNGKAPTALKLSREIGLKYGHPFLSKYGHCTRTGLSPQ